MTEIDELKQMTETLKQVGVSMDALIEKSKEVEKENTLLRARLRILSEENDRLVTLKSRLLEVLRFSVNFIEASHEDLDLQEDDAKELLYSARQIIVIAQDGEGK